ncbi:hypothetical protein AB6A40_010383 [Gnathostoma spinigerum]|uniref:4-nitrophenylphosphatase n=1 Tax=Gnathostoma spinigerum TaxID=75299 RepID=A0ABD6F1F7_9BILA
MVVGKPCRPMFDYVCNSFGINAKDMLMFGDRLDTDIKFGRDNGFETVLVGTGVHGLSDVKDYKEKNRFDLVPEYYVPSLKDCCDLCQRRL